MNVNPKAYQFLVLASALDMWRKHGIKANSSYTPRAMMRAAESLTGQKFRSRDYLGAAQALRFEVAK